MLPVENSVAIRVFTLEMDDREVGEGEVCDYDPHAYSYIDEKIETYLGHLRKEFVTGNLSAEDLGAKFGGYGSFLPAHRQIPSCLSQPNSQPKPPNNFNPPEVTSLLLPKLEEGEACEYTSDPDAYSYIDEKIDTCLGHLQKEFLAGNLSAENLGAKFGGYGYFLPTHRRSPYVLCQPRNPPKPPNNRNSVSPFNPPLEVPSLLLPKLEEGDACEYTLDPDAYSFIDEKIKTYLGHFQKVFAAGDLSVESLGSKFGGYGSFLPAHKQSPILSQLWSPA